MLPFDISFSDYLKTSVRCSQQTCLGFSLLVFSTNPIPCAHKPSVKVYWFDFENVSVLKNSYCHQLMFGKFTEPALLAEVGCSTRRAFRARPGCSSNTIHPTVPFPFPKRSLIPTAHRIKSKSSCHFSLPQFCPPCAFRPSL